MNLLIDFLIALFSGWLAYRIFGRNERGFLEILILGIVGGLFGYYVLAATIRDYTSPLIAKIIAYAVGAILFQLLFNLIANLRDKKDAED